MAAALASYTCRVGGRVRQITPSMGSPSLRSRSRAVRRPGGAPSDSMVSSPSCCCASACISLMYVGSRGGSTRASSSTKHARLPPRTAGSGGRLTVRWLRHCTMKRSADAKKPTPSNNRMLFAAMEKFCMHCLNSLNSLNYTTLIRRAACVVEGSQPRKQRKQRLAGGSFGISATASPRGLSWPAAYTKVTLNPLPPCEAICLIFRVHSPPPPRGRGRWAVRNVQNPRPPVGGVCVRLGGVFA